MKAISIQSGSNGNCIYVEAGDRRLLFDAGVSGVCAQRRLAEHGRDIRDADALLISHDHHDHVGSAGIFNRKFGIGVHWTRPTFVAAARKGRLGVVHQSVHFEAGDHLRFGDVKVETIPTPHDGVDGVAFVVEHGGKRLGILTDLGHVLDGLSDLVGGLDAVFLESNYDPGMLEDGPYPPAIKARIRGMRGHLSNEQCASLLFGAQGRLSWACLAHLSENNNTPDMALATVRSIVGSGLPIVVADRYGVSDVLEI